MYIHVFSHMLIDKANCGNFYSTKNSVSRSLKMKYSF